MIPFIMVYLLVVAAALIAFVIRDARAGREELLSLRNFFFLGMIIFQITGGAYMLAVGSGGEFVPADLPSAALAYAIKLSIFLVLFIVAGRLATGPIDRFYGRKNLVVYRPNPATLLTIAFTAVPIGLFTQFVLVYVPIIGPGMRPFAFGMFAVAAGLAAWAAIPRLKNPLVVIPAAIVILACLFMTFYQGFGRRNLVGIIVMVVWAGYYCYWRNFSTPKLVFRLVGLGGIGMILLLAVTSVRSGEFRTQSALQNIAALRDARLSDGFGDILSGQAASMASMWLIESRPRSLGYDTLHSVRMFVSMPIPRRVWPNKPMALAISMPQTEIYIANKPKDYNIGPGIIGHVENDNPWIALWLYPIFFGLFFRILDRSMAWLYYNPFVILPIGTAIGQVVAMPRGELGSFFFNVILNIAGGFVIIKGIAGPLVMLGIIKKDQPSYDDFVEEDAGYGADETASEPWHNDDQYREPDLGSDRA